MHPELYKWLFAVRRFHLRNFRFVVRENKVKCPAMELVLRSKIFFGNGSIFYMPPGPSFAPRRIPPRFSWFLQLPQCKVCRIVFGGVWVNADRFFHFVKFSVRKFAVIGELFNRKVDAGLSFVGDPPFY